MRQSVSSITSSEEFATGAAILEGHRVFAFPGYADLATTVVYLAATDKLLFERGTEAGSIRKHKLFLLNTLEQLQNLALFDIFWDVTTQPITQTGTSLKAGQS